MLRNKNWNVVHISLTLILILSSLQVLPFETGLIQTVSAGSTWTQTTEVDFNAGTLDKVIVTPDGSVKLALQTQNIEDNFIDESKINYKKNAYIDTTVSEVKQTKIVKTFGGINLDIGHSILQSSDGGYVIAGDTKNYGAGDSDVWLIKTDSYGNEIWNKTFGGLYNDVGFSLDKCSDNGFIIAGVTYSYSSGLNDLWLIKTDSSGNEQWNRSFGGSEGDQGHSVQQTNDGGYIITGFTRSYGAGKSDIWLVKTDSSGNEQWNKTFGGSDWDDSFSVQQTSDNGYIITGYTASYAVGGSSDIWLIKTDSSGTKQWDNIFGGSSNEWGFSVQQTSEGGYIITGLTRSFGAGYDDLWLIKTDSSGNEQWNRTFGGPGGELGRAVQQTSDNGYVIFGHTSSFGTNGFNFWMIKTDSSGNEEWNNTFGGNNWDYGRDGKQTSDGGYIITGEVESFGAGSQDVWLIKTDSSGNVQFINGELISKNLLSGQNVVSINAFNCSASVPSNSIIKVQFSQDNINWYNSTSGLNMWNLLIDGYNSIDLSPLGWQGSYFYYRINFTSDNINIPSLKKINLSYNKYFSSGTFTSLPFNSSSTTNWKILNWTMIGPSDTYLKYQLRTAENQPNLSDKDFVGPDGIIGSYYTSSGSIIWSGHNNDRFIQYRAYLSTIDTSQTPELHEVTILYNLLPNIAELKEPTNNQWTNNSNPIFIWNFSDLDSSTQNGFQWQADDNCDFNSLDYDSEEVSSSMSLYTPDSQIADGIWYWRVRTKDNDGDWGPYSDYWTVKIDSTPPNPFVPKANPNDWCSDDQPIIIFTATDVISGIDHYELSVNGGTLSNQTSPFTLPPKKDGIHNITVRAFDKAGNYRDGFIDVYIDTTAPAEFSPIASPSSWTSNNQPEISFAATDATSGIDHYDVKIDDEVFTIQTSPYAIPPQTDGTHSVTVLAYDLAGNYREGTIDVFIDTTPPNEFTPVANPSGWSSNDQPTISFSTTDATSGVDYYELKVDVGNFATQESPCGLPSQTDGSHTITVRAYDLAGNYQDAIVDIHIDTSSPEIVHEPVTKGKEGVEITINATVEDENSGVDNVTLYFKRKGDTTYSAIVMAKVDSTYSATISSEIVTKDLEYYIEASDKSSPLNIMYFGADGETRIKPTVNNDIDILVETGGQDNKTDDNKEEKKDDDKEEKEPEGESKESNQFWFWATIMVIVIIVIVVLVMWLIFLRKKKPPSEMAPPQFQDHPDQSQYPQVPPPTQQQPSPQHQEESQPTEQPRS